mmetsp:Transcript_34365/g.120022  ORF Transcript_34365/g.120022 Transcript_34365/m.120022 type:complete len:254 (-) Transcript_34365:111-872(-)
MRQNVHETRQRRAAARDIASRARARRAGFDKVRRRGDGAPVKRGEADQDGADQPRRRRAPVARCHGHRRVAEGPVHGGLEARGPGDLHRRGGLEDGARRFVKERRLGALGVAREDDGGIAREFVRVPPRNERRRRLGRPGERRNERRAPQRRVVAISVGGGSLACGGRRGLVQRSRDDVDDVAALARGQRRSLEAQPHRAQHGRGLHRRCGGFPHGTPKGKREPEDAGPGADTRGGWLTRRVSWTPEGGKKTT